MRVQINIHHKKINLSLIPYLVRTMVIGYKINNQLVTYTMLHYLSQFNISSETLVSDQIKLGTVKDCEDILGMGVNHNDC